MIRNRVGKSVESALSALAAIFRLLARILTIFDKKYRILMCRDKTESYLIVLQHYGSFWLSLAHSGSLLLWLSPWLSVALTGSLPVSLPVSHWLSLALKATLLHTLALPGSLLLSIFAFTVLDRLSGPLLGSHRQCHADVLSLALMRQNDIVLDSGTSYRIKNFFFVIDF